LPVMGERMLMGLIPKINTDTLSHIS